VVAVAHLREPLHLAALEVEVPEVQVLLDQTALLILAAAVAVAVQAVPVLGLMAAQAVPVS
jgi:hypothetical protein